MRVGHDWVVNGVGLSQRLEHHIIWTGTVLVGGALEEEREGWEQASTLCLDSSCDKVIIEHLDLRRIKCVLAQTHFVYFE